MLVQKLLLVDQVVQLHLVEVVGISVGSVEKMIVNKVAKRNVLI